MRTISVLCSLVLAAALSAPLAQAALAQQQQEQQAMRPSDNGSVGSFNGGPYSNDQLSHTPGD